MVLTPVVVSVHTRFWLPLARAVWTHYLRSQLVRRAERASAPQVNAIPRFLRMNA